MACFTPASVRYNCNSNTFSGLVRRDTRIIEAHRFLRSASRNIYALAPRDSTSRAIVYHLNTGFILCTLITIMIKFYGTNKITFNDRKIKIVHRLLVDNTEVEYIIFIKQRNHVIDCSRLYGSSFSIDSKCGLIPKYGNMALSMTYTPNKLETCLKRVISS